MYFKKNSNSSKWNNQFKNNISKQDIKEIK